jgi:hypothetical protein
VKTIDLSQNENWVAFVITGIITAPVIPLGAGPDMYVLRESHFAKTNVHSLSQALKESFEDFGFEASKNISLNDPKLLLIPVTDSTEEAIKNALIVSDMALALLNKKYFSAKARFLNWDRRAGRAIGAACNKGVWRPVLRGNESAGPAIVRATEYDFWDWFLSAALRNQLSELGEALYKCIEWERESQFSSHITHRFAFRWVGLEAMMPRGECQEHALVRRYSLIIGAPRGADSKIIMGSQSTKEFFELHQNVHARKWVKAIEEMYRYRCSILHDGSSDLNSNDIDRRKVDWFYHLTRTLSTRVTGLAVNALIEKVEKIDDFWNGYVTEYLYSARNHWAVNGTFLQDRLIDFDWENERYPDVI